MGVKNTGFDLTSVKSTNGAIFLRIEQGKLDEVKVLAKEAESCLGVNEEGQTPLHYAIETQHHEIALFLLKIGHEVNTADRSQWTPLISASKFGNIEVVRELLRRGAKQKSKDDDICEMGEWSAITWAAYRGHGKVLEALLESPSRGDPNFNGLDHGASYGVTPLLWAAGRGHLEAVEVLLRDGYGTDINKTDKFGCNALFWACRKGEAAVVKRLLKAGIDINAIGAHGQSALIVATRNMHEEVVEMLLTANLGGSDPVNVSHVDSDNNTALNFAADKGLTASVRMLLEAGASKNHQNKKKQTPLILAVKKGHQEIVRLLLNHDVNVNLLDKENRSALYLAVKEATMGGKNPYKEIIKMLVKRKDIYLEAFTKINDNKKIITETALLKAVRNRNASIVNILLKSGAAVDVRDQDWNNPLHLSIRFRDKTITEMLLRNPKNSNLVYKKNKENETPHEIDLENPVSILTKIWGEKIVTSSTKGLADDMSQYELYTNSLADILAEPELKLPITVGIFAKWGSGKDFLLLSLSKVMGSFVGDEGDVHYSPPFSVHLTFLFIVGWICTLIAGIAFSRTDTSNIAIILPCVAGAILLLYGTIMALATHGNRKYIENDRKKKWRFCNSLAKALTRFGTRLKLVFVMLFKTGVPNPDSSKTKPVKFLFANQARLNIGASENSLAEVIGALSKTAEEAYGFLPVRIYRAMKPRKESVETRSFCCLPLQSIFMLFWLDIFALTSCLAFGEDNFPTPAHFQTAAILTGVIGGVLIAILIAHYWQIIKHMIESPYSRVLKEANKIKEGEKSGREQLKREVDYLAGMVKAFDQYGSHQTRMVIVVNGLDSYKQDDVLKILELVNSLFTQSPYIVIFAVDDNLIRKAVDKDRKDTWEISGRDYLQNMIHLPFYMHQQSNDLTLRRRKILPSDSDSHFDMISLRPFDDRQSVVGSSKSIYGPQESRDSLFSPQDDQGLIRRRGREGRRNTLFENGEKITDSTRKSRFEKSKNNDAEMLLDEDWLSSISPQIMKRILNSKSLTGRLLRANFIPVSSDRLSRWIKLTELAPYRTSWIIWYIEENEDLDLYMPLKSVYQKILPSIPSSTQEDKVLAIDSVDSRDMEVLLSARDSKDALTVKDVVMFLPNTVNLDPNLREWIDDVFHTRQLQLQTSQQQGSSPSNLLLQPLTRVSETTEGSSETPQISAQGQMTNMISLSSVPAASQASVSFDLNCDEVANWVLGIENMSAGGKTRLEKYVLEQNITGNFLMKMRNKLQVIKTDTQLNLGDFFLLEEAVANICSSAQRDTSAQATSSTGFTPRSERHEPLGETTTEKGSKERKASVNFDVPS